MTDRLFSENIFHCAKEHSSLFAAKIRQRLAPTVDEMSLYAAALTAKARNAEMTIHDYYVSYFTERYGIRKDVAVIPVIGEMSRYSYWSYGNEFLIKCLESIDANEQYRGVVLRFDTPGGTADSCSAFADAVSNFSKPKIAQTNYCASAGVFVSSQCDEVHLEPQSCTQYGSIGTLIMYENWQGYLEKQGVIVEIIRAEGSEDKAVINPYEELTAEKRAELVARATNARKEFLGYVKRGRAGKIASEEVFTGKMYGTNDAIKLGLADRTGTMKDAVNRVISLSKK